MRKPLLLVTLPMWIPAPSVVAQQVTTLAQPQVEFHEPFSRVAGIRELPDGRVLLVDSRDRFLWVVDLTNQTHARVSRHGDGPGEYRSPVEIYAMPGDSSAIYDGSGTRMLMISPEGRPADRHSLAHLGVTGEGSVARFIPRVADSRGRLYGIGPFLSLGPQGLVTQDSIPIVRWDRQASSVETIAHYRRPSPQAFGATPAPPIGPVGPQVPFVVGDQWAVAADGRIAILRYDDYRVDFVLPSGERRRGTPNSFARLRLTDAHKRFWADSIRALGIPDGVDRHQPATWPEFLPPFPSRPALFAPDGILWVRRTVPLGARTLYDLIDRNGRVARQVSLPPRSRVVGFGVRGLYVVRHDEDDLQYLQRFALP